MRLIILLFCVLFSSAFAREPKIYDCFIFFNELELLEIRLNELYDYVDHFVLVECSETFRGNVKPFYYAENKERFKKFEDKIIYVCVTERVKTDDPWIRETFQKNQMARGLTHCEDHDIIMISDCDEIIRASAIPEIVENVRLGKKKANKHKRVMCEQVFYRFYLNQHDLTTPWVGTVATTYKYAKKTTPEELRNGRWIHYLPDPEYHYPIIRNAGWHFSSMGGLGRFVQKIESYSHVDADVPENKKPEAIENYLKQHCKLVAVDASFPSYLQNNVELFRRKGLVDSEAQREK